MTASARLGLDPQDSSLHNFSGASESPWVCKADCEKERGEIRQNFLDGAGAQTTMKVLCELADRSVKHVLQSALQTHNGDCKDFALLALGGFGRGILFPYSDLDLLFLFENRSAEQRLRATLSEMSRSLWDLGFKVSAGTRTMEECKRMNQENVEFHFAMLDRRFLGGDWAVFQRLEERVLPRLERISGAFLLEELHKLTEQRLAKYGNTIFHLEPNVKEAPGGLRDFHASAWLRHLSGGNEEVRGATSTERQLALNAADFVSEVRCFLHYANGRNDNALTYELQLAAAENSLGVGDGIARDAAEWMRLYYRHARTLHRQLQRSLNVKTTSSQTLWQKLRAAGRPAKSPNGHGRPFMVRNAHLEILDSTAFWDRTATVSLLAEAAQTGLPLGHRTERELAYILSHSELPAKKQDVSWDQIKEIFAADYPAAALRPMHRLGLLTEFLSEFGIIDSLVIRDFYHRYTVDEHSLRTIEHLQALATPRDARDVPFSPLWKTVERRDLLVLAMLLHDVGKGMPVESHVSGSLIALETAAARLKLPPDDKAEVHFLIERHLDMSATMRRRDIFDPATIHTFASVVGTRERLQRLCLLTYADIHAVNPEALTPWMAEMLWQLYVATANHLTHSLDSDRLHSAGEDPLLERVRALVAREGAEEIERFLEGFPRRYLGVHSPVEIANHFALHQRLATEPVQLELISTPHAFTLTLLTADRPGLFAAVAGVLAGWGMNIVKAEAFANAAGIILDTFHFTDPTRTFELNPGEIDRFLENLSEVLHGEIVLENSMGERKNLLYAAAPKVAVETTITFDDESSEHCSLMEIVTQDRQGLLYRMSSLFAQLDCNIEVALVDTEGQKAIDVFYLTSAGAKLTPSRKDQLHETLTKALS